MKKKENARLIARYFEVYRTFLQNNGLGDDSNSISVEDLIDYVEHQIEEDERKELIQQASI